METREIAARSTSTVLLCAQNQHTTATPHAISPSLDPWHTDGKCEVADSAQ